MAEVVGVVSGGIAIAGLAGSIAKSTIALKQLWDKFQDVPDNIRLQLEELELYQALLAQMEATFLQSPAPFLSTGTTMSCLKLCKKSLDALAELAQDIQSNIDSHLKRKRNKAKFKGLLKAETMRQYQERLGSALKMLGLCQQIYISSLVLVQPKRIAEELQTMQLEKRTVSEPKPSQKIISTTMSEKNAGYIYKEHYEERSLLTWREPTTFGSIQYCTQKSTSEFNSNQKLHIRVQLPSCLASKTWDLFFLRASSGWKTSMRPISIIADPFELDRIFSKESSADLFRLLSQSGHSIFDRYPDGGTLLHKAFRYRRFDIAIDLVRFGVSFLEADDEGFFPMRHVGQTINSFPARLQFFQTLSYWGKLQEIIELPTGIRMPQLAYDWARWRDISVFDLTAAELKPLEPPKPLWENVPWEIASPKLLLELFERESFPDSAEFVRSSRDCAKPGHIKFFAQRYIKHSLQAQTKYLGETRFLANYWRKLSRLAFRHIPLATLSPRHGCSPLLSALRDNWELHSSMVGPSRILTKVLRYWLQDLQLSGINLEAYGRAEEAKLALINRFDNHFSFRFNQKSWKYAPFLDKLDYGPTPQDWNLHWDHFQPEYAKDFWDYIDPTPLNIPGSWVE